MSSHERTLPPKKWDFYHNFLFVFPVLVPLHFPMSVLWRTIELTSVKCSLSRMSSRLQNLKWPPGGSKNTVGVCKGLLKNLVILLGGEVTKKLHKISARLSRFKKSPISFLTSMLNEHYKTKWTHCNYYSCKVNYNSNSEDYNTLC